MVEITCKKCGRTAKKQRPTMYCSKRCRQSAVAFDRCECGRKKAKTAWQCRRCYMAPHDGEAIRAAAAYKAGASLSQVAARLGCSVAGVAKMLKRQGVPTRGRNGQPKTKQGATG